MPVNKDVKILHVHGPVFDLFFNEEWTDWTRVTYDRKTKVIEIIAGKKRPYKQLYSLF